jgi:hypothetical protein
LPQCLLLFDNCLILLTVGAWVLAVTNDAAASDGQGDAASGGQGDAEGDAGVNEAAATTEDVARNKAGASHESEVHDQAEV